MHLRAYLTILDGDVDLIPFWLRLRRIWNVNEIYLLTYDRTPSQALAIQQRIRLMADRTDLPLIVGPSLDQESFSARSREKLIAEIHAAECPGQWGLFSDADEFPHLPGNDLRGYLAANPDLPYLAGRWTDRVAPGGKLVDVRLDANLESQFPYATKVRQQLRQNDDVYIAAPFGPQMHHPQSCTIGRKHWRQVWGRKKLQVHHFKWTSNTLRRLRRRLERIATLKGNARGRWAANVQRQIDYLERWGGGVDPRKLREAGGLLGV